MSQNYGDGPLTSVVNADLTNNFLQRLNSAVQQRAILDHAAASVSLRARLARRDASKRADEEASEIPNDI